MDTKQPYHHSSSPSPLSSLSSLRSSPQLSGHEFQQQVSPSFEYDIHRNYPLGFYFVDPLSSLPEHQASSSDFLERKQREEQTMRMADVCRRAEKERIKVALQAGKSIDEHHISACGVEASVQAMYILQLEQSQKQQRQQQTKQK